MNQREHRSAGRLGWAGVLLLAVFANTHQPAAADGELYRNVLKSTVWVLAKSEGQTSSGTGVLVDAERRLVITNYHVVGEARSAVLFFPKTDSQRPVVERQHYLDRVASLGVRGSVRAVDRKRDLALIELSRLPEEATALALAEKGAGPGDEIHSVGNPGASGALWVYTSGTVRSVYKKQFRTGAGEHEFLVVESQSPINSGDSGGPMVNADGELVAIAQAVSPKARLITYSVDLSEVRAFLDSPWKPAPRSAEEILKAAELNYTRNSEGHYEVSMKTPSGETRTVQMTSASEYHQQADVRKIWSVAATLDQAPSAELILQLLEQSGQTKIGAWAVERTTEGKSRLVYTVKLDAAASAQTVRSSMDYVARLTQASQKTLQPEVTARTASQTLDAWLAN